MSDKEESQTEPIRYSITVQAESSDSEPETASPSKPVRTSTSTNKSSTDNERRSRSGSTPIVLPQARLTPIEDPRRKSEPNPEIPIDNLSIAAEDSKVETDDDSNLQVHRIKTPTASNYSANTRRISSALKHSLSSNRSIPRRSIDSKVNFSNNFQIREYTGQHPAENVGRQVDDEESFYEPVNFEINDNGEIVNYLGKLKTGNMVRTDENGKVTEVSSENNQTAPPGFRKASIKSVNSSNNSIIQESKSIANKVNQENSSKTTPVSHTGILKKETSSGVIKSNKELSDSILTQKLQKTSDKVVLTNIKLSKYHITGEVKSSFFFDEQNCHIWYSIDNWRTFQENSAILTRTENPLGSDENLPKFANQFYYQFDIEIPMPQGCRNAISGKSLERRTADDNLHSQNSSRSETVYDDFGRSKYIQFYAVMRNQTYLYLDTDFKVYCLRLKENMLKEIQSKSSRSSSKAVVDNNDDKTSSEIRPGNKPLSVMEQGRKLAQGMKKVMKSIGKMV